MLRIPFPLYVAVFFGLTVLVFVPSFFFPESPSRVLLTVIPLFLLLIFLFRCERVKRNEFAIDCCTMKITGPSQLGYRDHSEVVFSEIEARFEFIPEGKNNIVMVVEYKVPELKNFGLTSILAQRQITLTQYIRDQLRTLASDIKDWGSSDVGLALTELRGSLHASNVTVNIRVMKRALITEV